MSNNEWSAYDDLRRRGFFCYASTRDGDLFRKQGKAGVRVVATYRGADVQVRKLVPGMVGWYPVERVEAASEEALTRQLRAAGV